MNELGLLDYLLIAFSLAFSWRMYHSAQPPPASIDNQPPQQLSPAGTPAQRAAPALLDADAPLGQSLKRIIAACQYPSIDSFLDGAKRTYEMVIDGFASGKLDACGYLLAPPVRDSFAQAIAARVARGETAETMFIGFRSASIADAGVEQDQAWIEVRFAAELVTASRNREGRVVSGAPGLVAVTAESWIFERDLRAAVPGWRVVATDNDVSA